MPNNSYHFLYDVASHAPPAGAILSRLSGGKIGNKSIWDEIVMEGPVGISFVDNQLAREAGVPGMEPMSEGELAEYIRMWLESIGVVASKMTMPDVLQEMQRVGEALADARATYMQANRVGVDVSGDVVEILDELESAFEELSAIKESLKKDQEEEMLEELEIRKQLGMMNDSPETAATRAPLVERLKQIVARRKNADAKIAEGMAVKQAQELAQQTLEQQWIAYLTGLVDELQMGRERFDPKNPRESFRQLLRQYITAFQGGANENVSKYLTVLRSVMAPIMDETISAPDFTALDQLVAESAANPGFQQLLTDIKGYYDQAWQYKDQAIKALQWGKELLRKLQAHVQGIDLNAIRDVGTMYATLGNVAEGLATRVSDLEAQLAAVTQQLQNNQSIVLTQSEALKEYHSALERIKQSVLPSATEQITSQNVGQFVEALLAAIKNIQSEGGVQAQKVIKQVIESILRPYLQFLQGFIGRVESGQLYTDKEINDVMSLFEVWDTINKSGTSPELQETLRMLLTIMGNTARSLLSYANTMIKGNEFFAAASRIVEQSNGTPESVIAAMQAIRGTLADAGETAKQDAARVNKLTEYMQQLAEENRRLMTNMDILRQRSEVELNTARAEMENLKAQLASGNQAAAAELQKLREQLSDSQRQLEVAKAMRQQQPLDLRGAVFDPERMEEIDPVTQYRSTLQAMATALMMNKMNPQPDQMRMIWLAFRMAVTAISEPTDAIQVGMDTLSVYQRLPLPNFNTRSYGLHFMGAFLDMLFWVGSAFRVERTGSSPTQIKAWTDFVNEAAEVWYQTFIVKPVGYLSMSVVARFATLGTNVLLPMLEKGELVNKYNATIRTTITPRANSQVSSNTASMIGMLPDLSVIQAYMQDIAYRGSIPDVPDFVFAYYILSKFQSLAIDEFKLWLQAARQFTVGDSEGLPLGRFLLTTNTNDGVHLVTSGKYFLAAEAIYARNEEVTRDIAQFDSIEAYANKWLIVS